MDTKTDGISTCQGNTRTGRPRFFDTGAGFSFGNGETGQRESAQAANENMNTQMRTYQASVTTGAEERDRLILENLPQVRLIARRIHDKLPESVSLDDLISTGIVGLITAIDNFDPSQEVKLKTYAEYKIRGAILDSLRELDWAPRQKRKKAKMIEIAISAAEQRHHRSPTEEEIASEIPLTLNEYHRWLVEIRGVNIARLECSSGDDEGRDLLQFVSDREEDWPSQLFERAELERLLASAIDRMPPVERTVLSLYYHEELTLREIASFMNVHESRVSQLKSQAILRLRTYMEERWPNQQGPRLGSD